MIDSILDCEYDFTSPSALNTLEYVMEIIFLQAQQPLTKTIAKSADGSLEKSPYPNVYEVTSITETPKNLTELTALMRKHAELGHCMLKGRITKPLVKESRAGSTNTGEATDWICLDIDGLPGCKDVDQFLTAVGLTDTSYIIQYSASSKIDSKDLRAHVIMRLDRMMPAPLLKQWLIDLNHRTDILRDSMQLTKTDTALRWPLDISVCQNDKLIYIAPPILKKIKDPYKKSERIQFVKKNNELLTLGTAVTNVSVNQERTNKRVNELREAKGLPARKFNLKDEDGLQILSRPDRATTYETRSDRGFVYFNLNGGDSWGYYHPEGNPKYIRNFKSEPTYLTKELIPEYWAEIQAAEKAAQQKQAEEASTAPITIQTEGDTYLAFCDRRTSDYWRGTYNASTNKLSLHAARTSEIIKSFMRSHGMVGDGPIDVPEWDMSFDPHDSVRVDPINKIINTFEPTVYMIAPSKKAHKIPRIINKVLIHALGNDPAIFKHFINWLAYIIQERDRTTTAWILHGTEGTGKGVFMNKVIRPLLGTQQTAMRRMEELDEKYNTYMEQCFVVYIDEIESKALANEKGVMAKLKNFITEEAITLRGMYRNGAEIRNYANIIFASNKPDPISIPKNDRRFNVAKYQPNKLDITQQEIDSIVDELQDFYHFLECYKVDYIAVKTPIESEDRNNMISISESSIDTIGSALLEGNMGFFVEQLPTSNTYKTNAVEFNKVTQYENVLKDMIERTDQNSGACSISREELRTLFEYTVGNIPSSPNKFTSLLKHHRIHISKVWHISKTVNGIKVTWKDVSKFNEYTKAMLPAEAPPAKKLMRVK